MLNPLPASPTTGDLIGSLIGKGDSKLKQHVPEWNAISGIPQSQKSATAKVNSNAGEHSQEPAEFPRILIASFEQESEIKGDVGKTAQQPKTQQPKNDLAFLFASNQQSVDTTPLPSALTNALVTAQASLAEPMPDANAPVPLPSPAEQEPVSTIVRLLAANSPGQSSAGQNGNNVHSGSVRSEISEHKPLTDDEETLQSWPSAPSFSEIPQIALQHVESIRTKPSPLEGLSAAVTGAALPAIVPAISLPVPNTKSLQNVAEIKSGIRNLSGAVEVSAASINANPDLPVDKPATPDIMAFEAALARISDAPQPATKQMSAVDGTTPSDRNDAAGQSTSTTDRTTPVGASAQVDTASQALSPLRVGPSAASTNDAGPQSPKGNPIVAARNTAPSNPSATNSHNLPTSIGLNQLNSSPNAPASISSAKPVLPIETQDMNAQNPSKTDLTIRMEGDAGQTVNVRIAERAGQIQISVRSNDPGTAATLRHELPALQTTLQHTGWRLESAGGSDGLSVNRQNATDTQSQDQPRQDNRQFLDWREGERRRSNSQEHWLELMSREQ